MKLHFEPNLDYQHSAIEAVCDLFRGQETCRTEFTVGSDVTDATFPSNFSHSDLGFGNQLHLRGDELHANLNAIQLRNGLRPSTLTPSSDFTVEMETGTGKTYVYLRTIFELNRRYGFTKFVVVVPSVAIKEGVYKSLQITEEHLRALYGNTPFEFFLYDSGKLGRVRNFATSASIQIMVVTVGAINKKDVNNLYKQNEKTGGEKPIDLIKTTRPILIVDEPQSVDGGLEGEGEEGLAEMNPLCTLRYSATHADEHNMLYRLDAVDAYERGLVKQIEVASLEVEGGHNRAYIKLLSTSNKGGNFSASVELDMQRSAGIKREKVTVGPGDDLERTTGHTVYANYLVQNIGCKAGEEYLEFSGQEKPLRVGQAIGDTDSDAIKRLMIRRTIEEHLDKELRLRPLGIKVLSLFFIDAVEHYRSYAADGARMKGKYATIFEEEYCRAAMMPKYQALFPGVDPKPDAAEVHDGYFSIDKKGAWTDTAESNQGSRDSAERAYNLIMRDKEKLLGFETKLKFIFSHSALREGWDNPNVFQICALRDMGAQHERRQTIGRGLRLCVNQEGQRQRGREINVLTVIATEAYERFAENLQKEIEAETGIRFGVVEKHQFAGIPIVDAHGRTTALGVVQSEAIWTHLRESEYLDSKGRVLDALRQAIREHALRLPAQFQAQLPKILEVLRKLSGKLAVKNASERRINETRQTGSDDEDFKRLWNRIKERTTYRLHFDNEKLLSSCAKAIEQCPAISKARLRIRKGDLSFSRGGVSTEEAEATAPIDVEETDLALPDLLTELQDKTQLTRRSLVQILIGSGRLDDFKKNPQHFIEMAMESINRSKRMALVDGVKYERIGDDTYYSQKLFATKELTEQLDKNKATRVFANLPAGFKIQTPLGTFNADSAVLVEEVGAERIYFVVRSKARSAPTGNGANRP